VQGRSVQVSRCVGATARSGSTIKTNCARMPTALPSRDAPYVVRSKAAGPVRLRLGWNRVRCCSRMQFRIGGFGMQDRKKKHVQSEMMVVLDKVKVSDLRTLILRLRHVKQPVFVRRLISYRIVRDWSPNWNHRHRALPCWSDVPFWGLCCPGVAGREVGHSKAQLAAWAGGGRRACCSARAWERRSNSGPWIGAIDEKLRLAGRMRRWSACWGVKSGSR
jgi:hypothetical protein